MQFIDGHEHPTDLTYSDVFLVPTRSEVTSRLDVDLTPPDGTGSTMPVVVANPTMPVGPGDRGLSPPTRLIRDFCLGRLPAAMDCTRHSR